VAARRHTLRIIKTGALRVAVFLVVSLPVSPLHPVVRLEEDRAPCIPSLGLRPHFFDDAPASPTSQWRPQFSTDEAKPASCMCCQVTLDVPHDDARARPLLSVPPSSRLHRHWVSLRRGSCSALSYQWRCCKAIFFWLHYVSENATTLLLFSSIGS
jgi:hypothetical protein